MNTDRYIDELIRKEKEIKANPFLSTRIMAGIAEKKEVKHISPFWQTLAVAASISIVLTLGIGVGSLYTQNQQEYADLHINDSRIENLNLYNTIGNE